MKLDSRFNLNYDPTETDENAQLEAGADVDFAAACAKCAATWSEFDELLA